MATQRQRRVQELLIQEISDIVRREVKDPRIGFVTFTDAEISPDLRNARVYVSSISGAEALEAALKGLNSASGFIRHEFARRASLRFTPTIEFRADTSIQRGARIQEVLAGLRAEETHGSDPDQPGGERDPEGE
jgi:ribosome-binding factor A